jgi:hypothetical protein
MTLRHRLLYLALLSKFDHGFVQLMIGREGFLGGMDESRDFGDMRIDFAQMMILVDIGARNQ